MKLTGQTKICGLRASTTTKESSSRKKWIQDGLAFENMSAL